MMKRFQFFVFFIGLFLQIASCKKDESKSDILVDYPLVSAFSMDVALDTVPVDSFIIRESVDFPTSMEGELAKNNTSKNLIKSAKLESIRLQILDYAFDDSAKYSNFKDIKEIYLYIKKDGIGEDLVAQKVLNPDVRNNVIVFDVLGTELKNYLQQETFRMVFKFKKRRQMHNEMPFSIIGKFKIVADPLN